MILPLPPMWFPTATSPTSGSSSRSDYTVMSKTSCYIPKIVTVFIQSDDYYEAAPRFYLSDPCYHRGFLALLMSSWLASQKVFNWDNHEVSALLRCRLLLTAKYEVLNNFKSFGGKSPGSSKCVRIMISWLLAGFPDPSATLRLTLHYVSRARSSSPTLCSTILMSCRDQSVSAAISYQTSGYCMCGTARYNSHYTFRRENMRWRHPTTPPHHQTLCSKRLEIFFGAFIHLFITV